MRQLNNNPCLKYFEGGGGCLSERWAESGAVSELNIGDKNLTRLLGAICLTQKTVPKRAEISKQEAMCRLLRGSGVVPHPEASHQNSAGGPYRWATAVPRTAVARVAVKPPGLCEMRHGSKLRDVLLILVCIQVIL